MCYFVPFGLKMGTDGHWPCLHRGYYGVLGIACSSGVMLAAFPVEERKQVHVVNFGRCTFS